MNSASALVQFSRVRPQPVCWDVEVTWALVLGCRAWIVFRYDRPERSRRDSFGLGSVLAWDLLDTLMDLPAGLPVPATALTRTEQRRVARGAGWRGTRK